MGFLLNCAYLTIAAFAGPWILCSRFLKGKSFGSLRQKLCGELPLPPGNRPNIWLHAVSVGEVLQLQPIVKRLNEQFPDYCLVITTTTTTGYAVAVDIYAQKHTVCYFPFDFTWAVRRALNRIRPALIVLAELELWPNFTRAAHCAGIPIALINGRITQRSWKRYRLIRPLIRSTLRRMTAILPQDEIYASRFLDLGAPSDRIHVAGSIKFDGLRCDRNDPFVREIRAGFRIDPHDIVLIAGSTQDPEEQLALDAYRSLKTEFPHLRLILVPRHAERFDTVAQLVVQNGFPLLKRSDVRKGTNGSGTFSDNPVLLLDTLGELSATWGLADIAFVGGSFVQRGGQNMIEPAGFGASVFFGPNTWNFRDAVQLLLENRAALRLATPEEFAPTLRKLLANPDLVREIGSRSREVVLSRQGASDRTLEKIAEILNHPRFTSSRAA